MFRKRYKFYLIDKHLTNDYFEWLTTLLKNLNGVTILEEEALAITVGVNEVADSILIPMMDMNAIPSRVDIFAQKG